MKKLLLSLLIIIFSFPAIADEDKKESAFDLIIRTNTIRCGYYVFPPATYRDPNTGALSGLTIDIMNEIGKRSGLKIEWTEEYSWSGWTESLHAKRFDVACTPNWPDTPSGRVVAYNIPMFYAGLFPVVMADNKRFISNDLQQFNREDVTFAAPEGDAPISIIQAWFPKAKLNILPTGTDSGFYGLQILSKKVDAVLWDDNALYQFNKNNIQKIRAVARNTPVKLQAFSMAVDRNEMVLKDFLDNAVHDLINDGTMDRLLRKWEPEPGKTFLRVTNPANINQERKMP